MKGLLAVYRNLPISFKLLLGYSSIFVITLLLSGLVLYAQVRQAIEANIESELKNTTAAILDMVRTTADNSIRNYMRAVAETNLELVQDIFDKYQTGVIGLAEAVDRARKLLGSQKIGRTGYIYCVDSRGIAQFHPNPAVDGRKFLDVDFVKEQIKRKEGYLEYEWRNPGETKRRPKALYMTYFEPWDWIISVSAYRDEFRELVNISDFRHSILALKFGKTGYSYVLDSKGNVVVHPKLKGNQLEVADAQGRRFLRDIIRMKSGKLTYSWKNPDEKEYRQKLVIFNYIPEFDWIVASSCYLDESYAPLKTIRNIVFGALAGALLLVLPLTLLISASISRPLRTLMERFGAGAAGDLTVRMETDSRDEVGRLARYFNKFMDRLEDSQRLEREVLEISEREHQKIGRDLHDDLGPHLIGIEALTNVLEQKLRKKNAAEATDAAKIGRLVGEAINKLRRLAKGLCPVDLGDEGLDSSLGELTRYVEEVFGVSCRLHCARPVRIHDPAAAANIYYIAHEALHNAVKHAQAKNIDIHLSSRDGVIRLKIEDDGRGIPARTGKGGMGLRLMRYRAQMIGGTLSTGNRPGGGALVTLEVDQAPRGPNKKSGA